MVNDIIRVGIVGLGANTRLRHVPGLRACENVDIVAVCNRRPESTAAVAKEYDIPKTFMRWQDLIADEEIDAVVIGTWPYLHCEITCEALARNKHVMTEARMARNAGEAHQMLAASRKAPDLVAQIVPSPFGLRGHRVVQQMLADGCLGQLREVVVLGINDLYTDPNTPFHWRQSSELSGLNMLGLGIMHETLMRWVPQPLRVLAQTQIFTKSRTDETTTGTRTVETPDSVHVLTQLPGEARGVYHLSSAVHFGPPAQIRLFGDTGTLQYIFGEKDRLLAGRQGEPGLQEVVIPTAQAGAWRVEEEFIGAIRGQEEIQFTDFTSGVGYMEFTEAVFQSAQTGQAVTLPLQGQ